MTSSAKETKIADLSDFFFFMSKTTRNVIKTPLPYKMGLLGVILLRFYMLEKYPFNLLSDLSFIRHMDREYTQDFVNVEDVKENVIILKEGNSRKYVRMIEIMPVDFRFKSKREQNRIIGLYDAWLKTGPDDFQIKAIPQRTDVAYYIKAAQEAFEKEKEPKARELIGQFINCLYAEARKEQSLQVKYYLIFRYKPDAFGLIASQSEEDIIRALNMQAERAMDVFRKMGCYDGPGSENIVNICETIYNAYNRAIKDKESFQSRVERLKHDSMVIDSMTAGGTPVKQEVRSILAPKVIGLMESKFMTVDGEYRTHLYVDGRKYPDIMETFGWLNALMNYGIGFDVDVFYEKRDSDALLSEIRGRTKIATPKLLSRDDTSKDANEIQNTYAGNKYIVYALQQLKQEAYNMAVLVTIHAASYEELLLRKQHIMNFAKTADISLVEMVDVQEDGFISSSFLNSPTQRFKSRANHIVLRSAVAAAFPFTTFKIVHKDGVYFGKAGNSMMFLDLFDETTFNANMFLVGGSGAGKTFALLLYLLRLRYHGVRVFALLPQKQHEAMKVVNAIGGVFCDTSTASKTRINVFDIFPHGEEINKTLSKEDQPSWLIEKIDVLRKWLRLLVKGISETELTVLDTLLYEMYGEFGITEDNDSIYFDKEKGLLKTMPIIEDLYNKVVGNPDISMDTRSVLNKFVNGSARSMNGPTNIDINNLFMAFGLENVPKDLLAATLFITFDYVWSVVKSDTTNKCIIAADEFWDFLSETDSNVDEELIEVVKLIRAYKGGLLVSTQSLHDLDPSKSRVGAAIVNSCYTKIILRLEPQDVDYAQHLLNLTDEERSEIERFNEKGEAMLFMGQTHVKFRAKAFPTEFELIKTGDS
ncbi:MAG: hypothetical protein IJM28_02340 [Lachnospiraceae bacterium]|nr:hypothetical protein [Lachnospiraceae bacterium]